jgi:hypothetical protein
MVMAATKISGRVLRVSIWGAVACLLIAVTAAFAGGGGNVIPAGGEPKGYSLAEAACATAYFNTGTRTPATEPDDFPFQILYLASGGSGNTNTFSVKPGTMFYVPVVYSDDTDSALWPYPDVTDPEAVSAYYFDPEQLGAEYLKIVVDGNETDLRPEYAVGAVTPELPSGGNNYTVVAAFLTPLSKGTHTVKIRGRFSGDFIAPFFPGGVYEFEDIYTVVVK